MCSHSGTREPGDPEGGLCTAIKVVVTLVVLSQGSQDATAGGNQEAGRHMAPLCIVTFTGM